MDHDGLKTFFGKENHISLKVGGAYEMYFSLDAPVGERGGEGNVIVSMVRGRGLTFTWNAPPEFPAVRNHETKTWVMVTFEETNKNTTEVVLTHAGWLEGGEWDQVFQYFSTAWIVVMDCLEKCFDPPTIDSDGLLSTEKAAEVDPNESEISRYGHAIMARAKTGADLMRELGVDSNDLEVIKRADEIEEQAIDSYFNLVTNGYADEHH